MPAPKIQALKIPAMVTPVTTQSRQEGEGLINNLYAQYVPTQTLFIVIQLLSQYPSNLYVHDKNKKSGLSVGD